ncbi:MAG: RnfABCDGE type electron transport complex subunit G [Tissierellia bacterium]|nr:RnfABCDGE type electron transport complex subunit G [Tissierellia bacterium]
MKETIKLGLTLFLITAISASILAFSNKVTSVRIAEADKIADQAAKTEVLPDGEKFEELEEGKAKEIVDENSKITEIFEGYKGDELVGYTIKIKTNGYGGEIEFMTGISTEGKITGIKVLNHGETPGLGANATKAYFTDSFKNKPVDKEVAAEKDPTGDNEVQAITSATVTTDAVVEGVNIAREAYNSKLAK